MPEKFVNAVQSVYNQHCEKSDVFIGRNATLDEALFYPVGHKGSGRWAVNRERAEAWLIRKNLEFQLPLSG
jgi:hypothetical protein